ncbi:MAG: Fic family protein [Clostridia bacterium]|nr:Fic family protein [Clostridia bacterium]
MENYTPPYTISNKMLSLVSEISDKVSRLTYNGSLEARPHLRKNNKIRSIHSSLAIEANSLSLGQVKDVINNKMVLGEQKEIQEVKNAYEAYEMLSVINPFNVSDLKKLHSVMTKYLVDESGEFRKGEEGVFSGDRCIFMAPPASLVPELMEQLFSFMNEQRKEVHPLIMSAVFHYEFVFIHPFSDGNGRMARLWHTALLYNWKPVFEYIPIESQIEKFQQDYYEAIAKCHINGDSNFFIEFMLEQIDNVLDELLEQVKSVDVDYSAYTKKLVDVMKYDVAYTAKELMELLDLKSRSSFRENYLIPAIKGGFVEMTLPDKPNSRNQRYILTN